MVSTLVRDFTLPKYNEIPSVGLYLEQVSKYITECLEAIPGSGLTTSMISNYVKKKLVSNPVKKQYSRQQIAHLIFIAITKSALSMNDIKMLTDLRNEEADPETEYNYFVSEFESVFNYVFGFGDEPEEIDEGEKGKAVLRASLLIFCYKAYIDLTLGINENDTE